MILSISARRRGLLEITKDVLLWLKAQSVATELLTLPEDPTRYAHDDEGPGDMPAHLRTALTQVHLAIPVVGGRLVRGTWQGIYVFAHRREEHLREIALHLIGE